MQTIDLNGVWRMTGQGKKALGPFEATVPGNIELELVKNNIVPDPYFGSNEKFLRPYEFYDWTFTRDFDVPADFPAGADLVFDCIDTVAEVYLNDDKIAEPANGFIRHTFAVDDKIKRGQKNTVAVVVKSPILAAAKYELDHRDRTLWRNTEGLALRKPIHEYGWDICPRCCLGGITRNVKLVERPENRMISCYFDVLRDTRPGWANILFTYNFATSLTEWDEFKMEIEMKCGDSVFKKTSNLYFTSGHIGFGISNPKLWWPLGYGEQNLYDATIRVYSGEQLLFEEKKRVGLRSMVFEYDEDPKNFVARFVVNGTSIMVKGSNWVPTDALHSLDYKREIPILELFTDLGCNMLRIWGGGTYCTQAFYDYCDEHGIMIWHDFMIACALAPQREEFMARFATEVEWAVKELRQHPSLALWAGDNEVDAMCNWSNTSIKPSSNRLTREVIPHILNRLDPNRPYQKSSPYYSPESEAKHLSWEATPEQHVWGPRDYFKSPFYADNNAVFISECGYHGANSVASMKKFLSADNVWPWKKKGDWYTVKNEEWLHHATLGYDYRIPLMFKQIREEFMLDPDNAEDFSLASQIVQAEAKKFFVENVRIHKWKKAGILWWNVMDCWPQFSDAIVDYYFDKKLAYDYLKRSQKPVLGIIGEWRNWAHEVVITNDTLQEKDGRLTVTDADSGQVIMERDFHVAANANQGLGRFELPNSDQRLLIIRWETKDGIKGANHYITGRTPLDYKKYRDNWLPKIKALGN